MFEFWNPVPCGPLCHTPIAEIFSSRVILLYSCSPQHYMHLSPQLLGTLSLVHVKSSSAPERQCYRQAHLCGLELQVNSSKGPEGIITCLLMSLSSKPQRLMSLCSKHRALMPVPAGCQLQARYYTESNKAQATGATSPRAALCTPDPWPHRRSRL